MILLWIYGIYPSSLLTGTTGTAALYEVKWHWKVHKPYYTALEFVILGIHDTNHIYHKPLVKCHFVYIPGFHWFQRVL
jgi:hypothetical protein